MAGNFDNNQKKADQAADSSRAVPAALSRNHQMLVDRLTRKPAPLRSVSVPIVRPKTAARIADVPAPQPIKDERRGAPRRRMLKGGVISHKGGYAGLRCTVRELSKAGARIRIDDVVHVPDQFELIIEIDGLYAKSQVV